MGVSYHGPRHTMDIDLTAALALTIDNDERIRKLSGETARMPLRYSVMQTSLLRLIQ